MNHAVIMAGGGGTRLWPASRRRRPKQLLPLGPGGESLLHATVRRMKEVVGLSKTLVVTAREQLAGVAAAAPQLAPDQILAEPVPRNTAAAIGLAAVFLLARDPDAVIGAVPADHHIGDESAYLEVLRRAYALAAAEDAIVTVGIRPTGPETGFGYLELGGEGPGGSRLVARFREKPERADAEAMVARGDLWNGGLFFFRAARIVTEIERHLPLLGAGLQDLARALAEGPEAALDAIARIYPRLPAISIDHGVMERTAGILTLPGDFGWNDIGSFTALAGLVAPDAAGNSVAGRALLVDARDNVVFTDDGTMVALVGVEGLVVVRAGDAVLVIPRERAQEVREVVRRLEQAEDDGLL